MNLRTLSLLALLAGALSAPAANAGSIYKCQVDGKTVYQDAPCENAADAQVHLAVGIGAAPVGRMSVGEIQDEMRALNASSQSTSNNVGSKRDPGRVLAERENEARANQERRAALQAELQRRCPRGSSYGGRNSGCQQ